MPGSVQRLHAYGRPGSKRHPIICLHGLKSETMSWWRTRSHFSGQSGDSQYSSSAVEAYGGEGEYHEPATGNGNKRSPSRPKRSSSKKVDDEYDGNNNYSGTYSSGGGGYNGYAGSAPYNNGTIYSTPYYGGGGGGGYNNNNSSSYGNGGDGGYNNSTTSYGNGGDGGYNGGAAIPYNAPSGPWGSQDSATRSPMYINTREVHFYGMPGPQNDDDYNSDQRRRGGGGGGGGGFFRPALEAVGHFVDRKLGFNDRN